MDRVFSSSSFLATPAPAIVRITKMTGKSQLYDPPRRFGYHMDLNHTAALLSRETRFSQGGKTKLFLSLRTTWPTCDKGQLRMLTVIQTSL